jgi:hypothetical protein
MMNEQILKAETNTTDATVGQNLRDRVAARAAEIKAAIADPATDDHVRKDLQTALDQVQGMLTGDLDQIPRVVSASLNMWLEANKHLDEHHAVAAQPIVESSEPSELRDVPATPPAFDCRESDRNS